MKKNIKFVLWAICRFNILRIAYQKRKLKFMDMTPNQEIFKKFKFR